MCGIVGAVALENVVPTLLEGLQRLAYRGYDSAGIAVLNSDHEIHRTRTEGKVDRLQQVLCSNPLFGKIGIAHTRWATHGAPSEQNAHPMVSNSTIALVHNGIIENHDYLKSFLLEKGYEFSSQTDTEVAAHLLHHHLKTNGFLSAVRAMTKELEGTFAFAVICSHEPERLVAVRKGSPLVVGLGEKANYISSDNLALLPVTNKFMNVEEGDLVEVSQSQVVVYDLEGNVVSRKVYESKLDKNSVDRGHYRHYMLKEIYEQPRAVENTLEGRILNKRVLGPAFGVGAEKCFDQIKQVQIAACGTSYHAGLVGRYWLESIAKIPCQVEIASELRYRHTIVRPDTLFITLSQSGETADTLAALRQAKELGYAHTLTICNVPESSLVRESEFTLLTRAGAEIGVASTKAFVTQLVGLGLLTCALGRRHSLSVLDESSIVEQLIGLPGRIEEVLTLDKAIQALAMRFVDKEHVLFLGRGAEYPIAMEGALKLKELSYIHAEAYPAGELKHGPLALVDRNMPVIAVAPNDELLEKLKSNLQEVRARGGELIVFGDGTARFSELSDITMLSMPSVDNFIAPIVYTVPLQLLAYYVAVLKGTDVDQPRNLAKSVTVE